MSEHSEQAIKQQVRNYVRVFVALMVLTVVTVAISYLHLPILWGVALAMAVALTKGTLVASVFMHLSSEKKIILYTLALTVFFAVVLLSMPSWHHY